MRLIDVDRLVNDIAEHITVKAVSRVLAITQGQPIVEAIPVEWLRERASRMLDFGEGVERIIKEWQDEQ